MADLIDRSALPYENQVLSIDEDWCLKVSDIEAASAVDAEPVVRCKECTYKRITKGSMEVKSYSCNCTWSPCRGRIVEPSFFCFYGERKTNATD